MKRLVAVTTASLFALGACGGGGASNTDASVAPDESKRPNFASCEAIFGGSPSIFDEVPTLLASIGPSMETEQISRMMAIEKSLNSAIDDARPDLATALRQFSTPFDQFTAALEASSPTISLDTSGVMVAATDVMSACAVSGYSIPGR